MYSASQRKVGEYRNNVRLEIGAQFLAATLRASAAYSRRVYRVSASDRDLLIKNMGFYYLCSSYLNKVALIETPETVM